MLRLVPFVMHAVATTPAGPMESDSLVLSHQLRPSLDYWRVGSCIPGFEACSAFTHVTACMTRQVAFATLYTAPTMVQRLSRRTVMSGWAVTRPR